LKVYEPLNKRRYFTFPPPKFQLIVLSDLWFSNQVEESISLSIINCQLLQRHPIEKDQPKIGGKFRYVP